MEIEHDVETISGVRLRWYVLRALGRRGKPGKEIGCICTDNDRHARTRYYATHTLPHPVAGEIWAKCYTNDWQTAKRFACTGQA